MIVSSHLHRLSKFAQSSSAAPAQSKSERDYEGQLIFSGPDAAIQVEGGKIRGYINGQPSHPTGQLNAMIDEYEDSIRDGVKKLTQADTVAVILSGKWHHIDFNSEPRIEMYLVHLVDKEGNARTERYQSEIFDWDEPGMNEGGGFTAFLPGDPASDVGFLSRMGEKRLAPLREGFFVENGLPAFDGVLWCPSTSDLPFHVTMARPDEDDRHLANPGHGTALSALRARIRLMRATPGKFREAFVDRANHRPPELTLEEVFASTDAVGYWTQTWDGMSEPYAKYELAVGKLKHGDVVLRKIDPTTDPNAMGNTYASEWERMRGLDRTNFRVLALLSVPAICGDPL